MNVPLKGLGFERYNIMQKVMLRSLMVPEKCVWYSGLIISPTLPNMSRV